MRGDPSLATDGLVRAMAVLRPGSVGGPLGPTVRAGWGAILLGKQQLPALYLDPILTIRARYRHGRGAVKVIKRAFIGRLLASQPGRQVKGARGSYPPVRVSREAPEILTMIASTAAAASFTSVIGKSIPSESARYWSGQRG